MSLRDAMLTNRPSEQCRLSVGWYEAVADLPWVSSIGSMLQPAGRVRRGDRYFVRMTVVL